MKLLIMLIILLAVLALMIWKRVKFNKKGRYIISIICIIIVGLVCKWFNVVYIDNVVPKGMDPPTHYYSYSKNGEHTGTSPLYTADGRVYRTVDEIKEGNKKTWLILAPMIFCLLYFIAAISGDGIKKKKGIYD
ncbi:MAG: hypothetical protein LBC68_12680 [Prevotellaceae bacterium]|jgi:hypothetical protein|nr:hypothetical protein [Prevotellaceae bacterium]